MYFYELNESDDDLFASLLLAHDAEYDEQEFLDLVLESRDAVMAKFEEDSLIEAIANELQRQHGFVYIDDRQLRAAVNVSSNEGETVNAPIDVRAARTPTEAEDFRTMLIEVEIDDRPYSDN